jgi:hypothetical protein
MKVVAAIVIGLVAGAVLGVLVDWLLKPLLPQTPTLKHSIAGFVACVAIVGSAVPFARSQGEEQTPKDNVVAADQVRECMRQHDLQQAQVRKERDAYSAAGTITTYRTMKFAQCEWPPPNYAGDDGYSEISVTTVEGPGASEAEGETGADRITAPCQKLKLSYSHGKMNYYKHLPPVEVSADSIYTIWNNEIEPWEGKQYPLGFYPERGEFVVLYPITIYSLDEAVCVT